MAREKSADVAKVTECKSIESLECLSSLRKLPSDIVHVLTNFSDSIDRGKLMYQVKVNRASVIQYGGFRIVVSLENDIFVIYRVDMMAFSIYRGGIFHKHISLPQIPHSILVRDGLILVRYRYRQDDARVGFNFKIVVYTSDGFFNSEFSVQNSDPSSTLCDYRVCDESDKTNINLSVTWFNKNITTCQCYNAQSILLSSFDKENPEKHLAAPVWMERNATFVRWEGNFLKTYDKFGDLIKTIQVHLPPIHQAITNFSMINGDCHKFEFLLNNPDQRNVLKISNRHGSWHHQVSSYRMSLCLTSGNCATEGISGDGVFQIFNCFY